MDGRTRSRLNCFSRGGSYAIDLGSGETMRKEGWFLGILATLSVLWLALHAFNIL